MYAAVKHIHIACVVVSITGFFLRGLLMLGGSPVLGQKWLRWAPHVNDTLLLTAAIVLSAMSAQYPLVEPWLTAKIFGLIAYIVLGSVALKAGRGRGIRLAAWLAALATFAYVASVALRKSPWGFLIAFQQIAR
jgi:uncharacterized membrane protein SirB2